MSYQSWSVSFAEQPSASKWNILGTNDAYFNSLLTGQGTIPASVLTNLYKFSVTSASNTPSATGTQLALNTKKFDSNNNFNTSTHIYTVPVAGFYQFNFGASFSSQTNGVGYEVDLRKNGAAIDNGYGNVVISGFTSGFPLAVVGSAFIQLAANDTIDLLGVGNSSDNCFAHLTGHFVCFT